MANLTTKRWERYVPDLGDNRELPEGERLELEVATGLTSAEMQALAEATRGTTGDDALAALALVLEPYVRVRGGPHTINGADVRTLGDYLKAVAALSDGFSVSEVTTALVRANTLTRDDEVFLVRQSGGWVSTPRRAAANADVKTVGR